MKFLLILLILIPVIIASDEHNSEKTQKETKGENELKKAQALRVTVKGNSEFAINLFKHVTAVPSEGKESPVKNVAFSPLSISVTLSLLSMGARSKTHQEIKEGLSLNNTHGNEKEVHQAFSGLLQSLNEPKSSLKLDIGNAIFLEKKLNLLKSFKDDAQHHYRAEIKVEDFSHLKEVESKINEYVKNKTEGKIEELVKDLSEDIKMVLINYVLFHGKKRALTA